MFKSVANLVVIAMVFCLAFSTLALAENQGGALTLTPMVSYQMFDGDLELDDAAAYGFGIGYNITPEVGLELDIHFTPTEAEDYDVDVDVWTFGVSGLYHFQPEADLNPYLAIGLGCMAYDVDGSSSMDEDYMVYWGGGFKYAVGETSALRFDLRHIIDRRSDNEFASHGDDGWANHVLATVGMTFQFNGYSSRPTMQ